MSRKIPRLQPFVVSFRFRLAPRSEREINGSEHKDYGMGSPEQEERTSQMAPVNVRPDSFVGSDSMITNSANKPFPEESPSIESTEIHRR